MSEEMNMIHIVKNIRFLKEVAEQSVVTDKYKKIDDEHHAISSRSERLMPKG